MRQSFPNCSCLLQVISRSPIHPHLLLEIQVPGFNGVRFIAGQWAPVMLTLIPLCCFKMEKCFFFPWWWGREPACCSSLPSYILGAGGCCVDVSRSRQGPRPVCVQEKGFWEHRRLEEVPPHPSSLHCLDSSMEGRTVTSVGGGFLQDTGKGQPPISKPSSLFKAPAFSGTGSGYSILFP